ncbi:MAG: hypothetical protein Q9M33_06975 [Robiginitomaculum sp.]|nr:hypothetical protein [Robiginitomaculum sp.]MDQ7077112.1 hypothetical protein [Robiginitomaculum sp.]
MFRTPVLVPVLVFSLIMLGLLYVAKYQRPPVPGRLLPKTPQTLHVDADQLTDTLEHGPWVSPGLSGRVLYKIGYRSCPDCISYEHTEFKDLHAAGVDTRVILYARRNLSSAPERAVIADLACTREWPIYERWMSDVEGAYYFNYGVPPAPETSERRSACLEWGRIVRDRVGQIMARNGWNMEVPALFWKNDKGEWRFFLGNDARGKRLIRSELGVPLH